MTPQSRLIALKNLGVEITPEIEAREYRISLETIERNYGVEWEQDADAVRGFVAAAEAGDQWIAENAEVESTQLTQKFGEVKITASDDWRKRHLHQSQEKIDQARELRQAWFGKR